MSILMPPGRSPMLKRRGLTIVNPESGAMLAVCSAGAAIFCTVEVLLCHLEAMTGWH